MVSIKSLSSPNIELPAPEKRRDQKHIEWLFRQDTPLFLGIVDKSEVSLRLYSLLPLWFIYYEGGLKCGSLTILPRVDSSDLSDVGRPKRGDELPALPGMYHYDVDVGHPVAEITIHSIKDEDRLRAAKNSLRIAIRYARLNLVHFQLGIPYFYWFAKTFPDGSALQPAYFCLSVPPEADHQERILGELAPSLICFALHYKAVGNAERLAAIGLLLSGLPREFFPLEVRDHLPEIFA